MVSVGLLASSVGLCEILRHMTADLNREKFNLHLNQWRVVLYVVLRFVARREASLLYTTVTIFPIPTAIEKNQ